ncbi:MAG: DUF4364 family protein [Ruminococcaceae bacterium]|nr:DUF4364 family protein [Oscillospiraceae bacterium]
MPRRTVITEKNEIKLYLLYLFRLFEKLGQEVDFDTLSEVIMWEGAVNHFDFSEAFANLLDNEAIVSYEGIKGGECYIISEKGNIIIDNMADVLLADVRENTMRALMRFISYKKDGSVYSNKIVEENGGWRLKCALRAKGKDIVSVNLYSDNKQYLEKISINFSSNAEKVINTIVGVLTGDIDFLL